MLTITSRGAAQPLDVLGAIVELLTDPADTSAAYCVIKGAIPANTAVPLHSHPDDESFFVVSGTAEVLTEAPHGRLEWRRVEPGDFIHIPGDTKHAHRNRSGDAVVELVTTTSQLGRFFQEIGRPAPGARPLPPPGQAELDRVLRVAQRYGHWMATPAENASVGLLI
jgi:quercetin dioxygenase-like cupin family protein